MFTAAIEILDARFKELVHGNVHLEKLHSGCRWAEGPAYFPAGRYLVWSDIPNDRMLRYDESTDQSRYSASLRTTPTATPSIAREAHLLRASRTLRVAHRAQRQTHRARRSLARQEAQLAQ